jgi:large subunit ribosomal protein L9
MKVILLQDIENLGKKCEIKEVKNGYARNFLLPNKLVKPATKQALKCLNEQK